MLPTVSLKAFILAVICIVALTSCRSGQEAQPTPEPAPVQTVEAAQAAASQLALVGTAWEVEFIGEPDNGVAVIPGTNLTLNFLVDRYAGSGGCNWFLGTYSVSESDLTMYAPAESGLQCQPTEIMNQESTYMSALINVTNYRLEGDKLLAFTVEDQQLLTLKPAQEWPLDGTTWDLKFVVQDTIWKPLLSGTKITLRIEGDQITGTAGCNEYSATAQVSDAGDLTIGDLTVGDQVCNEPEGIMDQESAYLAWLPDVQGYVKLGGSLGLQDAADAAQLLYGAEPN